VILPPLVFPGGGRDRKKIMQLAQAHDEICWVRLFYPFGWDVDFCPKNFCPKIDKVLKVFGFEISALVWVVLLRK
jgi:hypothetical protein